MTTSTKKPLPQKRQRGSYKKPWWGVDNQYPLSPELELCWIGSQLSSAKLFSPRFSLQKRSTWKCQFDPVLFQRACDLVVERNEILRTRLIQKGSTVLQLLSKLFPYSSANQKNSSKFKHLKQAIIALLEKPDSIGAKLVHRLIHLKTAFYGHEYVESLVNKYQKIITSMAINPQGNITI